MKDLQEATEKICQLKGECIALQTVFDALIHTLPPALLQEFANQHARAAESARVTLLNSDRAGEHVISAFDLHTRNMETMIRNLL